MAAGGDLVQRWREQLGYLTWTGMRRKMFSTPVVTTVLVSIMAVAAVLSSTLLYAGPTRETVHDPIGDLDESETLPLEDADNDGLSDLEENYIYGTNLTHRDSDGDLMDDGWEVLHGRWDPLLGDFDLDPLDPLDADRDPDGDDLVNWAEFQNGTDPHNSDTDGDMMGDGWEAKYSTICAELQIATCAFDPVIPDDGNGDEDGDGLINFQEADNGTNPLHEDTDLDDLSDWDEISRWITDPINPDTDGDIMWDGWEVRFRELPVSGPEGAVNQPSDLHPLNASDAGEDRDRDLFLNVEEFLFSLDPNHWDTDRDGMGDGWEHQYGWIPSQGTYSGLLDPHVGGDELLDADSDLLLNGEEYAQIFSDFHQSTNPLVDDTDADTLTDYEEVKVYETDPTSSDTDGDTLEDGDEINGIYSPISQETYYTNASNPDTDGDGLNDSAEIFIFGTNATNPDTDNDGLMDRDELFLFEVFPEYAATDPRNPDSDGDGLVDGLEVCREGPPGALDCDHRTNPAAWDTDGDGMADGWEDQYGWDPDLEDWIDLSPVNASDGDGDPDLDGLDNRREYDWNTDPFGEDTDQDGMPDGWEVNNSVNNQLGQVLDPRDPTDANGDPDNDSWDCDGDGNLAQHEIHSNLQEFLWGTDPNNPDTDGDGINDGFEICYG